MQTRFAATDSAAKMQTALRSDGFRCEDADGLRSDGFRCEDADVRCAATDSAKNKYVY